MLVIGEVQAICLGKLQVVCHDIKMGIVLVKERERERKAKEKKPDLLVCCNKSSRDCPKCHLATPPHVSGTSNKQPNISATESRSSFLSVVLISLSIFLVNIHRVFPTFCAYNAKGIGMKQFRDIFYIQWKARWGTYCMFTLMVWKTSLQKNKTLYQGQLIKVNKLFKKKKWRTKKKIFQELKVLHF